MKYVFIHKDKVVYQVFEFEGGTTHSRDKIYIGTIQEAIKIFSLQKIDYSLLRQLNLIQ